MNLLHNFTVDARKLIPALPEHAALTRMDNYAMLGLMIEQANVTSAAGKFAVYLMYYSLSAYLSDKKITPPTQLMADMRKAFGVVPTAELQRAGAPKSLLKYSTSKQTLRDNLPELLRWNRKVRENTRIPQTERQLLTLAIRCGKADVSDSATKSIEKIAYTISPDLGAKVTTYLHGPADGGSGTAKKASKSGIASMQAALKAQVKALGGSGYTLALDHAKNAKARAPAKYSEYLKLRADLRKRFEIDWRQVIIANDNKPLSVTDAEKAMRGKGYELLFIPTKDMGYTGKIGMHLGKIALFTNTDKLLQGSIAPGARVTMNKKYDESDDNAYYMSVKVPGAVTKGSRIYTAQYKKGAVVEKFKKADQVAAQLPTLLKRWLDDLKSADPLQRMEGTAACVLYLTGARVGNVASGMASRKGVAAFGILNLRVKHIRITTAKIIFSYPGKKGVAQRHEIPLAKPSHKLIAKNLKEYIGDKGMNDMLWSTSSITGRKTVTLTYAEFNRYIKSMGFTQGAHKLRHVRGTQLVEKLLEQVPFKFSKSATTLAKRKKEAETYMKDKILSKVADLLGHRSTTKTGGTKPAWQTSITSYVMPNIVREWFKKQNLDTPNWVPAQVGDD